MNFLGLSMEHIRMIRMQEQAKRKLEVELKQCSKDALKQNKTIDSLAKERERLLAESLEYTKTIKEQTEEINLKLVSRRFDTILRVGCIESLEDHGGLEHRKNRRRAN